MNKLIEKYCTCVYGWLGTGRMDSSWCPRDDGMKEPNKLLEWGARGWDEVAVLEQRTELIERAEAQMIGEDAQPHTEWLWYFDALASQEEA